MLVNNNGNFFFLGKVNEEDKKIHQFKVGDAVLTKYGLAGTVVAVHENGTCDVEYHCKRFGSDLNVKPEYLKLKSSDYGKSIKSTIMYDMVEVDPRTQWVDHSAISSNHIVSEKRRRARVAK